MNAIINENKFTKNGVCVDWFEFTLKIKNPCGESAFEYMVDFLQLPHTLSWNVGWAQMSYKSCMFFENTFIFYNPALPENGIHCRMSGQGCRTFEKYSDLKTFEKLFDKVINFDYHFNDLNPDCLHENNNSKISRMDIAYDDFEGLIDLEAIADAVLHPQEHVVSRWSKAYVINGINLDTGAISRTINFGSQRSDKFLTIYDKLQERKSKDILPDVDIWNRAELKLRNSSAWSFALLVCSGKSMLELYFLTLNNQLRIVEKSETDKNRWRWTMAEHWKRFANSILDGRICLYAAPSEEYNTNKLENYVLGQAGAAIYTYLKLFTIYDLIHKVNEKIKNPEYRLNTKYVELLEAPREVLPEDE